MKKIYMVFAFLLVFAGYTFSQDVPSAGPIPPGTVSDSRAPFINGNYDGAVETAFAFQTFPTPTQYVTFPIPGFTPTVVGPGTFTDFASSGVFAPNGTFFLTTAGDVTGTSQLFTINTSTGASTLRGTMTGVTGVNGITYDPTTGTFYVCTGTSLYTLDTTTGAATLVGPLNNTGGLMAEIAVDCNGVMYGVDLGLDNTYTINKSTGAITLLGPLGFNLNFGCGMTYDKINDILYLFGLDGTTSTNAIRTINTTTGAATTLQTWTPTLSQFAPFDLVGNICPGGGSNETLILMHTETGTTVKRSADRDTLLAHLPSLVSGYDVMYFDTTTSLSSLSGYKTIIISETSFDAANTRYLGATARGQITAWLNTGTPSDKKALLMIGGDLAYNYSRAASPGQDLAFANLMGYIYRVDNGMGTAPYEVTGTTIDIGNTHALTNAPAGGGYYPDGASPQNGGVDLYKYRIHTAADTLAAIGRNTANYVVASSFVDARYYTGGFKSVLSSLIGYLVSNGGTITGLQNISNNVVDKYSLGQNYPNPFNPTTKIKFALPKAGFVSLKVYDMLGREVQSLVNQQLNAGEFVTDFDGANLSSGTYFYRLQVGDFVEIKKMVLLK